MAVAEDDWGQSWDGVIRVRNTVLARSLACDEVCEVVVADARATVGVDVDTAAVGPHVDGAECGDGTAQGVTGSNDAVAWVLVDGLGHGRLCRSGNLIPSSLETLVDFAFRDEGAVGPREDNVGDEVANVVAAAHGEDNLLPSVVSSNVSSDASDKTAAAC